MAFAFSVVGNIPTLTQTGTDGNLLGISNAITAVPTVARNTAYTTAQLVKPPTPNGLWYRCSTAGTTSATAPTYGTTEAGTTTDGTAVFTAFFAPDQRNIIGGFMYYMPGVDVLVNGTLTNQNPAQGTFASRRLIVSGTFTSGRFAADGVTPLNNGVHYMSLRPDADGAGPPGNLTVASGGITPTGNVTFIGGELHLTGAWTVQAGAQNKYYYTRFRSGRVARFRNQSSLTVLRECEFYNFSFDRFASATEFTVKCRASEYVFQYIGSAILGTDAKFTASNIENLDGTNAVDNYTAGWVELYNCGINGPNLGVITHPTNSSYRNAFAVALFQDVQITARDTAGSVVQDVRFSTTDAPSNSPTRTITTLDNLKTWDVRNAQTYETTTNASGVASTSPMLTFWYINNNIIQRNQRFASNTASFQGRAYNYKTITVSALLGATTVQALSAGMVSLDTPTTITEAQASAITGISLVPSGANGGTITISSNREYQDIWNHYRWWISQLANKTSDDTWTCIGGKLNLGDWNLTIETGIELSTSNPGQSIVTNGLVTNNGIISMPFSDALGSRVAITGLNPENFDVTWFIRYRKVGDTDWALKSGTGNSTQIIVDLDEYELQARVAGYTWKTIIFDTNVSLLVALDLQYHVSANNTPQYTMTFDEDLEALINFDPTENAVSVQNTTGQIIYPGFAELYQATQRIQHLAPLVWTWTAPITANSTSQKILIPNGNPVSFFLTEDSDATVKVTCPVIHADTGVSADDRVKGNSAGYSIILGSPATAESAGLQSAIVSDILAKLGGANYSIEEDNLKKISSNIGNINTNIGNNQVELIEAIGTPLQTENYTAPDNDSIGQILSKVELLENTDLTGIATTENVTNSKTEILQAIGEIPETDISALALENSVQSIQSKVDLLENYNDEVLIGKVDAIGNIVIELENYDDTTLISKVDAIQTSVDNIDVDFTPVLEAVDLTLKTSEYTAPDNAKIAEIKTKVDTLQNADFTITNSKIDAVKTKVDTLENYNDATAQSKLDAIKAKTDDLVNTNLEGIATTTDVENAKTEILEAVNNIQIDNEAIATEVWNQEPERLKQVATVETTGEQIASFNTL